MLNIAQLVRLTPEDVRQRAFAEVRIRYIRAIGDVDSIGPHKLVYVNSIATTIKRVSIFKIYGDGPDQWNVHSKVWCSCSCEHYKYRLEAANALYGSATIIFSNGALPRITNPGYRPQLCKHLFYAVPPALRVKLAIGTPRVGPAYTQTGTDFRLSNATPIRKLLNNLH